MKKRLIALCQIEIDPMSVLVVGLVIATVLVMGRIFTERVSTVDDYAMEETEMYLPAL